MKGAKDMIDRNKKEKKKNHIPQINQWRKQKIGKKYTKYMLFIYI